MSKRFFALSRFERTLAALSLAIVLLGAVQAYAQVPAFVCAGNPMPGCAPSPCASGSGVCSGMNYTIGKRVTMSFRKCNGAAGTCTGGSTTFTTCVNTFYKSAGCPNPPDCTLTSSITGCP